MFLEVADPPETGDTRHVLLYKPLQPRHKHTHTNHMVLNFRTPSINEENHANTSDDSEMPDSDEIPARASSMHQSPGAAAPGHDQHAKKARPAVPPNRPPSPVSAGRMSTAADPGIAQRWSTNA